MSNSTPIINPYYNKWDTPKPQNRFQKAVFNGRSTKVNKLLVSGENIYVSTNTDESPLFMAIVRDHQAIVNQILDIYEEDLLFVRQFFQSRHNINWKQRLVFVAYGPDHCAVVEQLSTGMEILPDPCPDEVRSMVILLKASPQDKKVLWLQPNNREENKKIAEIIECIWDDGVIDLQHKGHWGRTVLDVAAIRNQTETYCRLDTLLSVDSEKSIEHFLQMCRHHEDKLEFFKQLWSKTGKQFDIADIMSTNANLLVLPAYHDQFEIFYFFLESLADKTATPENRQMIMTDILNTYKVRDDSKLIESIIWADNKEFVKQCILHIKPNLLLIGSNCETVLQSLIRQKSTEFMTQFIVEYFDHVMANGMENRIVKQLIEENWLDAIKILYNRYESCRSVLFRDKKKGVQCLLNAIDGCRYNLANYLVDAHRLDLTDPDDVTNLILYCAFVERSNDVLQTLLTLPAADPLRISGPEHFYKSPLYVALKFRHLKNFRLLLDNVNDVHALRDLKTEDDGENLLYVAIWFKENPVDETPFVYVEEEQASLEVVDSSDDEDESYRKRVRNEQLLTSTGPIKDPIMPDSFFEEQSIEMNRIFSYFLSELSLDYKCVNNTGETLLHVAVKRDNYDAAKQLLGLGLDPNAKDNAGNYLVHGVRSVVMLTLLLDYKCDVNVTNLAGETPLLSFVKEVIDDADFNQQPQETFLIELLRVGANINHADVNGLTALHMVKSVRIARILLQHEVEINAKNKDGETPILYVFRQQSGAPSVAQSMYKLFLCDNRLDVKIVTDNNVSLISVLVSLDEKTMSEVLISFTERSKTSELEDIFVQHCNTADHYGCPVIVTACSEYTNTYCLDKLLNMIHLDPNVYSHYPPLEASVRNERTVKRLIDRGANVNGIGEGKRKTPLICAIGGGHSLGVPTCNFATVALLLAAGADMEIIDEKGDSALDYASRLENLKDARRTIAALIIANVDYYRRSGDDKLPVMNVEPFQCLYVSITNI